MVNYDLFFDIWNARVGYTKIIFVSFIYFCIGNCLDINTIYYLQIVDITGKIEIKKKEIEKLGEKDRALNAQFLLLLGEKNQWAEYLTKVYKKKIKRAKKKVSEDGMNYLIS